MNKVILMGRLTRDPEVRYGANGNGVAHFGLAVDRRFKRDGQPDADFFNCTAFGKLGEFAEKYLKKGTKIVLDGHIQTGNYTNKDGQRVNTFDIIADSIEFAESKAASAAGGTSVPAGGQAPAAAPAPAPADQGGAPEGFMSIPEGVDDELPFS